MTDPKSEPSELVVQLIGCLPMIEEGPDHKLWCSVRGDWLRAAVDALTPAPAQPGIDELRAEVAELDALRDKLSDILSRTAIALRGPEPPLTRWGWHDLPERAAAAVAAIAVMQKVAVNLADTPEPAPCEVCGAAPCGWCDPAPAQPEPPTAA